MFFLDTRQSSEPPSRHQFPKYPKSIPLKQWISGAKRIASSRELNRLQVALSTPPATSPSLHPNPRAVAISHVATSRSNLRTLRSLGCQPGSSQWDPVRPKRISRLGNSESVWSEKTIQTHLGPGNSNMFGLGYFRCSSKMKILAWILDPDTCQMQSRWKQL